MTKFKVGDVVRILPKEQFTRIEDSPGIDPDEHMYNYCGRVFIVSSVVSNAVIIYMCGDSQYRLKEINDDDYNLFYTSVHDYSWAERWLEPVYSEGVSLYV